jgi:large subunit ribosomal protein L9|tara:strand:+ start:25 stop:471 length:447 start_codon:yes stop_codon:yes gene_type:complete
MKVILKEKVNKLGNIGDIVEVPDGQARNHLIPKKLAVEASDKNLNDLKAKKESLSRKEEELVGQAKIISKKLDEIKIKIYAKENNGKLFGSITSMNISEEIARNKININKKNIEIKNQITTVGIHPIRIKLYKNMFKELSIEVLSKSN